MADQKNDHTNTMFAALTMQVLTQAMVDKGLFDGIEMAAIFDSVSEKAERTGEPETAFAAEKLAQGFRKKARN